MSNFDKYIRGISMLSFVLCDDNKVMLEKLSTMLKSIFVKHNIDAKIDLLATKPQEVLDYFSNHSINVLFLDIDLKTSTSGLDLAESIRKYNKDIYIIFTSAHLEYILIAYRYKTFDFIPKPITPERLNETIVRLLDDISCSKKKPFFIRLNNNSTIIEESSVYFIKKEGMQLIFYTENREYKLYSSFKKLEGVLPPHFIRCHKSYIVNINHIGQISSKDSYIIFNKEFEEKCFIGPKYKNYLVEVLKK